MAMTKKKIILEDGRYLIYYSFDEKKSGGREDKSTAKCCDGKCCGGAK